MNSMVASVYERRSEISILSAIGLAPSHIGAMFLAEAFALGVLGCVGGYLVAQFSSRFITQIPAFSGLTINFSSTGAVLSAALVLGTSVLSAVYPARIARKVAAPGDTRLADPPQDGSDEWIIPLPFRIDESQLPSLLAHFAEWFRAHEGQSIGGFVTEHTGETATSVTCELWPAPFDLGVSQALRLEACPSVVPGIVDISVSLTRLSGERRNWIGSNRAFLAAVRKQFLAWNR
jgi:hypothetical protein